MKGRIQVGLVLLIAALTAGIIISFVGKVRQAAERMACTNNLRQIGMAIQDYHDTNNRFPLAVLPNSDLPPEKRLSWLVAIIPFIEGNDLSAKMDLKGSWDSEPNRFAALTRMQVFQCPSYTIQSPTSTFDPTQYIGIAGLGGDAALLPAGDRRGGFFGYERQLGVGDDGKTYWMVMATETMRASGSWTAGGFPTVRGLGPELPYLGRDGQFGGLHLRVSNTLFSDGSVLSVSVKLSPEQFESIACQKDKYLTED